MNAVGMMHIAHSHTNSASVMKFFVTNGAVVMLLKLRAKCLFDRIAIVLKTATRTSHA